MNGETGFVHLHVHSDYSLLDGAVKVKALARRAAALHMPALALTDHGSLFGAVDFYLACKKEKVKPILGMEAYVTRDRRETSHERSGPLHHLVLLAETEKGWHNLIKLSSLGYLDGLNEKPRLDKELLAQYHEGLIATGSCLKGELNAALLQGNLQQAKRVLAEYQEIFGRDSFFVEIQNHGLKTEARHRELAAQFCAENGARMVATNDVHYLEARDAAAHDVLMAIQTSRTVDDPSRWRYEGNEHYLKSAEEMAAAFPDFPDAMANTVEIAQRCQVELKMGEHLLPVFPLPPRFESSDEYLRELAREGARERFGTIDETIAKRLDYELDVIRTTGFAGYFLIVSDFVRAAREMGIPVGPGRGSAAGSLVCYSIRITDVDPLAHGLLFERFLNPERVSMPDIDIDFCFERRSEIIDFVNRKYGSESVCQIITYGAMLARGVLRDVGRAMGMNYGEVDRIAKMVPEQLGITLKKALENSAELREVREEDPRYDRLLDTSLSLEGLYRHTSIHAAGVLIAPGSLTDNVPLYKTSKNEITTQWDMKMVETMGLLKMDFLGLRTLTVIEKALDFVRDENPDLKDLEASAIPLTDPAVYEMLGRGETVGVFQLESSGMREVLRKLKPTGFEDITAVNALYRPGPLGSGMVEDFIERKHGRKRIEYPHPLLEPILKETYGVILYQEQVMRIAGDMAGFSMGQADTLRKAMGKKNHTVMTQMERAFVDGAVERGVKQGVAQKIFDLMAYFAGYGFNKSHSASYAVLSVRTAWLKRHYPAAFLAATLTSEMNNTDRVVALIDEARHLSLTVLPPDVNTCTADFKANGLTIRFGLGAVKNVGRGAIEAIVQVREELGGSFSGFYEFCERVDGSRVNRRVIESLIYAGALDSLPGRREQKLEVLDQALRRAARRQRDRLRGQAGLFESSEEKRTTESPLPEVPPWDEGKRLEKEKELLGLYLTGHPLNQYRRILQWLKPESTLQLSQRGDDRALALCGVVHGLKTVVTRSSGRIMAFLTLEDFDGPCEVICFPDVYEEHRVLLSSGEEILFVAGRSSSRSGEESKLVLEKAYSLSGACRFLIRSVKVRVPADLPAARVEELLALVKANPGKTPLNLRICEGDFEAEVTATRASVEPVPALLMGLVDLLGEDAVQPICLKAHGFAETPRGGGHRRRGMAANGQSKH